MGQNEIPKPLVRHKLVTGMSKAIDLDRGKVEAIASTEAPDASGDIIRQAFWDLRRFHEHPVLIASHNYRDITAQIGHWESMGVQTNKVADVSDPMLVGVAQYYINQGNPQADWAFKLASKGLAAFSVGFQPDWEKAVEIKNGESVQGSYEFNGQELLEVSHVTIPSNPEALQRMSEEVLGDDIGQARKFSEFLRRALESRDNDLMQELAVLQSLLQMTRDERDGAVWKLQIESIKRGIQEAYSEHHKD